MVNANAFQSVGRRRALTAAINVNRNKTLAKTTRRRGSLIATVDPAEIVVQATSEKRDMSIP
jgi:hypothetical protein